MKYVFLLIGLGFWIAGAVTDPFGSAVRQAVCHLQMIQGVLFMILAALVHQNTKKKDEK